MLEILSSSVSLPLQMHPYANLTKHDAMTMTTTSKYIFLEPSRQRVMKSEKHLGKSTKNEDCFFSSFLH